MRVGTLPNAPGSCHRLPKTVGEKPYRDANGLIVMCMYCHRTRRVTPESDQWDLVEAYAITPPVRVSHGICKACLNAALLGT